MEFAENRLEVGERSNTQRVHPEIGTLMTSERIRLCLDLVCLLSLPAA
jgi:hypothetical protein